MSQRDRDRESEGESILWTNGEARQAAALLTWVWWKGAGDLDRLQVWLGGASRDVLEIFLEPLSRSLSRDPLLPSEEKESNTQRPDCGPSPVLGAGAIPLLLKAAPGGNEIPSSFYRRAVTSPRSCGTHQLIQQMPLQHSLSRCCAGVLVGWWGPAHYRGCPQATSLPLPAVLPREHPFLCL